MIRKHQLAFSQKTTQGGFLIMQKKKDTRKSFVTPCSKKYYPILQGGNALTKNVCLNSTSDET